MSAIDYPGSFCIAIYDFIKASGGLNTWRLCLGAVMLFSIIWIVLKAIRAKDTELSGLKKIFLSNTSFLTVLFIGIIILKLPNTILDEQNVDESNWIVNAATFYNGGILWKNVTGGTGGPLIFIPLSLLNILGIALNYNTIRVFGLFVCILPAIYFVWRTILNLSNAVIAAVSILPLSLLFITANHRDFVAYNSEHVPFLLTAISIYLLLCLRNANTLNLLRLSALGIILGLFPWAKLQAMPIGFAIGVLAIVEIVIIKGQTLKERMTYFGILSFAALVPTLLFATYILANGTAYSFWQSYIADNLLYAQSGLGSSVKTLNGYEKFRYFFLKLFTLSETRFYLFSYCLLIVLFLASNFKNLNFKKFLANRTLLYCVIIVIAAYVSVVIPPHLFVHYLLLFIIPLTVANGVILANLTQKTELFSLSKTALTGIVIIFLGSTTAIARNGNSGIMFIDKSGNYTLDSTALKIKEYSNPNEKMAIWGWAEHYHVNTGLILGNNGGSAGAIFDTSYMQPRLAKYMYDLNNNKPTIFLDAVAPSAFYFNDTAKYRHENYDTLQKYITNNYTLKGAYNGYRVYVLNERLQND